MERYYNDVNRILSPDKINEMEERRIVRLNEAGISEDSVIGEGSENLNNWNSAFNENIVRGKADVDFCFRDQWTVVERSEFMRVSKPCMMFNVLYDPLKKVVGEYRKNKPNLMVRSLNGLGSQKEIDLRTNLIRTISYQSQNDLVYQTAFKSALSLSFGAYQIGVEYESPKSFNKVIRYYLINDATTCAWDPCAQKPHKGDGNFCSRGFVLTRDEFFATYPYITNPVSWVDPFMLLNYQAQTRDLIVFQDYYKKEWYPLIIYKLSNGLTVTADEWKDLQKQFELRKNLAREAIVLGGMILNEIPKIVEDRQTQDYKIMHYRMLRNQIIDFSEWKSKQLPIPFVDGDSTFIEGRQYTKSFIHEAKDAQKTLNYYKSETAAEIKNRRREQWMATPDNIKGYEQQWRNPEVQIGALMAQPDPKTGAMPIKSNAWEISQGLLENSRAAYQDIQEILGISQNESGVGRDISGKARRERKMEGGMSADVFLDNMNQAVEQGGRIVNDLLSYVIGQDERQFTITKQDGKTEMIILNKKISEDKLENALSNNEFDVEISAGPSFAVQKEIALEFFQETLKVAPQAFNLIADLWVANLDIQQMQLMKDRFKTLVPPEMIAKEEGKEPPPPKPPSPQEQLAQAEIAEKMSKVKSNEAKIGLDQQKLDFEKQELEFEKQELLVKWQELQEKLKSDKFDHAIDLHKTMIGHSAKAHSDELGHREHLVGVLADLHKHKNPIKESKTVK